MMIEELLATEKQPAFRLKQFNQAYYRQLITSYDTLTNWPKNLREKAAMVAPLALLKPLKTLVSQNQDTVKVLFARANQPNHLVETVLMRHKDRRNTVCVSCMVGCPMGCVFCATGTMGFVANHSADEIVEQVLFFSRYLLPEKEKVTNIVFMGMGEPMINLDNTQKAIAILTDPGKVGMSSSRITISTCGVASALKKFVEDGYRGRLAISLHAPTQPLRETIMPVAKQSPLNELFPILDLYVKKTNKRISYEYILIKGVNDDMKQAEELATLLKNRLAHVNLIPYNPVANKTWVTPEKKRIFGFASVLKKHGVEHTIRVTMGADINAACGQLATNS